MTTRRHYLLKISLAVIAFIPFAEGLGWSQQEKPDRGHPFILSFPHKIDPAKLWINYMVTGTFGGVGNFVRPKPEVWDYAIETVHESQPVKTLKVILYIPGYQAQTMDLSSLIDTSQRNIDVQLRPLATVPFSGRVLSSQNTNPQGLTLEAFYSPSWLCEFYNLADCGFAPLPISSTTLDKEGRFSVVLPDFAHDQTVSSFKEHGSFEFTIWNMSGGKILFRLKPKYEEYGKIGVAVTDKYPDQIIFELEPR
jgi:hypothetical protein